MNTDELQLTRFVWYHGVKEIDDFMTRDAAEMAIRRYLRLGFGESITTEIATDGALLLLRDGVLLDHMVVTELRPASLVY